MSWYRVELPKQFYEVAVPYICFWFVKGYFLVWVGWVATFLRVVPIRGHCELS